MNNGYIERLSSHDWMSKTPGIDNLSLRELTLPGAHNAGCDWNASYDQLIQCPNWLICQLLPVNWPLPGANWLACQDVSFAGQLNRGARALDLRLFYDSQARVIERFRFQHGGYCSSRTLDDLVRDVKEFLQKNPDEFIILDFHELKSGATGFNYDEFKQVILRTLGEQLIPLESLHLTLGQLKARAPRQRILLAAPVSGSTDDNRIHDAVIHRWIGQSIVDASDLHRYIDRILSNPPDKRWLWSLSATCYTLGGPQRILGHLDTWFHPSSTDWAKRCNIINFDFIENARIVSHCKNANIEKAVEKAKTTQPTNYEDLPTP
ncbi:phospholipase [Pseudomonas sp. EA_65y_Pfl2_P74]|uniref:phospholipase n=1 Tax=Pseudomonas sp. EA_65y_Pfl2_P74 TaxID=3088694 RepID=UPI0030DA822C